MTAADYRTALCDPGQGDVSYSLNSLKGDCIQGITMGVTEGELGV